MLDIIGCRDHALIKWSILTIIWILVLKSLLFLSVKLSLDVQSESQSEDYNATFRGTFIKSKKIRVRVRIECVLQERDAYKAAEGINKKNKSTKEPVALSKWSCSRLER